MIFTDYKDIKSLDDLPADLLFFYKRSRNEHPERYITEAKHNFGGEVVNTINPNDNRRWIYEVEYLDKAKTLNNSRMLWCVVEYGDDGLYPIGLNN